MNKVHALLFGSAVLALASFSVIAVPQPARAAAQAGDTGAPIRRPRMHAMFGAEAPLISMALKHQTELNLTGDQVATLEKIRTDYQNDTSPMVQQLRSTEGEIRSLLQENPANLVQVKLRIEEAEKLRSDLRYRRVEALENGKSVLTPQQQEQLKSLFASMRQHFRRPQGQAS